MTMEYNSTNVARVDFILNLHFGLSFWRIFVIFWSAVVRCQGIISLLPPRIIVCMNGAHHSERFAAINTAVRQEDRGPVTAASMSKPYASAYSWDSN